MAKLADKLLMRGDAAEYITQNYFPCSPATMAKWACISSDGPPFRLIMRKPYYAREDIDAWAKSKIGPLVTNTKEAGSARK